MAKFTAHGRFKPLINDRTCDLRECFQYRVGVGGAMLFRNPFEIYTSSNSKNRFAGWSCRATSVGRKGRSFLDEERLTDTEDEERGYEELEKDELACFRGLVLDISYRPVNVVCWRRAICLEFTEKADVLEYYDQTVSSPRGSFYIPAVLRVPHLLQVVKRRRIKFNLSRKSIFHRDSYTCQYCSSRECLTIDHVLPMSKGGEWKWENLVTACAKCNSRKGQKTLEQANMKLTKIPKVPKDYDILTIPLTAAALRMLKSRRGVPEEWEQYLSKPAP